MLPNAAIVPRFPICNEVPARTVDKEEIYRGGSVPSEPWVDPIFMKGAWWRIWTAEFSGNVKKFSG